MHTNTHNLSLSLSLKNPFAATLKLGVVVIVVGISDCISLSGHDFALSIRDFDQVTLSLRRLAVFQCLSKDVHPRVELGRRVAAKLPCFAGR
jgi:hypothetical protein